MKKQEPTVKNIPTKDEQRTRLMEVKSKLGDIDYTIIWNHEFNENRGMTKPEKDHMRNFWNHKLTDLKLLNQFEWIYENINQIPQVAKQNTQA